MNAKLIIILIGVFVLFSCFKNAKTNNQPVEKNSVESLVTELENLGYYNFTDNQYISELKVDAIKTGFIFGDERTLRNFLSDSEALAEGGIPSFLEEITPFLATQNIQLKLTENNINSQSYSIILNDENNFIIYNPEEIESENIWELSTYRSFGIINRFLEQAGSKERLYILYGGNDLQVVILTKEMFKAIEKSTSISESEKPIFVPNYLE